MGAHLAIERLSAYLDDELDRQDSRLVEAHVVDCPCCQRRLHGLRRVVEELRTMPTATVPPLLGRTIEREASARWRARRADAFRRITARGGSEIGQSLVQLAAAMVVAVAMVALLVAHAMTRQPAAETRLVVPPAAAAVDPAAARVETGGRDFVLENGVWWQDDLLVTGQAVLPGEEVELGTSEALRRAPWLEDLLRRGPVVLELDGTRFVVRPQAAPPG